MTDSEMEKAMEICKDKEIPCDDCPLVECGDCEGISRQYFYDRFNELKSENAELKSRLTHANEECLKWHERAQNLLKDSGGSISGYEKKISDLQAENAALRERLEKAVELKAKVGDTIYMPWIYDDVSGVGELQVCAIHFLYDGSIIYSTDLEKGYGEGFEERRFLMKYNYGEFSQDDFGSVVYTFKEAALARLAELKGEK